MKSRLRAAGVVTTLLAAVGGGVLAGRWSESPSLASQAAHISMLHGELETASGLYLLPPTLVSSSVSSLPNGLEQVTATWQLTWPSKSSLDLYLDGAWEPRPPTFRSVYATADGIGTTVKLHSGGSYPYVVVSLPASPGFPTRNEIVTVHADVEPGKQPSSLDTEWDGRHNGVRFAVATPSVPSHIPAATRVRTSEERR